MGAGTSLKVMCTQRPVSREEIADLMDALGKTTAAEVIRWVARWDVGHLARSLPYGP